VSWGTPSHLTVETTVAEASLELIESRTNDAAVFDDGHLIGIVTMAELARIGATHADTTLGDAIAARQADSLGPFTGSPCDHRPYSLGSRSGMVHP
jgi:CBS domain-containing protein